MSRTRCHALLASLLLTFCTATYAQTRPAPSLQPRPAAEPQGPSPAGATVLQAGTQLVVVDVVVRDKNGKAIHGLTRNDFVLSESKLPQTLRAFDEYSATPAPVAIWPNPKLPPGTFTDYTPVPVSGPLNVLLIDALNTPLADQAYLQNQLKEYVKHAQPGTRIAIFGLANHLYFLQGFTSDPHVLQKTLERFNSGRSSPLLSTPDSPTSNENLSDSLTVPGGAASPSDSGSVLMTSSIQTFIEQIGVAQIAQRSQQTIEGLTQLGHWLANFPGRKNLLWFSGSFPFGVVPNVSVQNNLDIPAEDDDQFRALTNLLTKAQISVYPIDPRGVQVDPVFEAGGGSKISQPSFQSQLDSSASQRAAEHSTMQAIASDTGGEPFYNRNDLVKAVTDVIDIGGNYYTLAYSPSEHKTGGEWRSIHIELSDVATHSGLSLSYRRGYFADNLKVAAHKTGTAEVTAEAYTPKSARRTYAVQSMTRGAPMPSDILFTTRILPHSTNTEDLVAAGNVLDSKAPLKPPYRRYEVDALARPSYFKLTQQPSGNYTGAIELAVFVYSPNGKLLNAASKKLILELTPENYATFQKINVGLHLEVSAPAQTESFFRIGVQDVPSNRIGVVEVAASSVSHLAPSN